ncbi:DUF192 domain-containing protein [Delftia tsuruhatensis]|jgi:hypothetical protein|nr:DUF192 domain-containing protein [Delftia tsuruhatensis]MBS3719597.1 hypothetical protein [Delftia sp. PE138]MPT07044.1 DUF192 domain-containing protein [Delftia sp.]OJX14760.1 MAG: hypothetical protein BGO79_03720 [Delftia sp. 67-8]AOV05039.1 hypothetical protein BI380_28775 [Delftia tsuruhatensis]MPT50468.1 DUF192 domain-containing protein [Delftia sp.]
MQMPPSPFLVRQACGFWQRLAGLMGQAQPAARCALLIARCTSVHTCFMRQAIDIVYLDRQGRITGLRPGVAPWRLSRGERGSRHVLEMRAGAIACQGLVSGMQLQPWPIEGAGAALNVCAFTPDGSNS